MNLGDIDQEKAIMPEKMDLYEILQVDPSAHPDVIDAAYHRLALLCYSDSNVSPDSMILMGEAKRAYDILRDPEKRAIYDAGRDASASTTESRTPGQLDRGDSRVEDRQRGKRRTPNRLPRWRSLGASSATGNLEHLGIVTDDPDYHGRHLVIRFVNGKLEIYIHWNMEVAYSKTITVYHQIDGGEIKKGKWQVSDDRVSSHKCTYIHPTEEQIAGLYGAEELKVWTFPFGGDKMEASFSLEGFREAVLPILAVRDQGRKSLSFKIGPIKVSEELLGKLILLGVAAGLVYWFIPKDFLKAFMVGFILMSCILLIVRLPYVGDFVRVCLAAAALVMFLDHSGKNRRN